MPHLYPGWRLCASKAHARSGRSFGWVIAVEESGFVLALRARSAIAQRSLSCRCGQQFLSFADETGRAHGPEELECMLELVLGLARPPGLDELLGGTKPCEGGRPGCADRVQRLGCRHEVLFGQLSGGDEPGRIAPGSEPPPRLVTTTQDLSGKHAFGERLVDMAPVNRAGAEQLGEKLPCLFGPAGRASTQAEKANAGYRVCGSFACRALISNSRWSSSAPGRSPRASRSQERQHLTNVSL
jgi:hypothetical protein